MNDTFFGLLRHGETAANAAGLVQGHWNTCLSAVGVAQAQAAAERLAGETPGFDLICTSDLTRAFQTAEIVGARLNVAVRREPGLREWKLGEFERQNARLLWEKHPAVLNAFQYDDGDFPVPGGELRSEFEQRVAATLHALATRYAGKRILLVTHGGTLRALLKVVLGPLATAPGVRLLPQVGNASYGGAVRRGSGEWQLTSWNETAHLRTVGFRNSVIF